jgi:hypothetical protein
MPLPASRRKCETDDRPCHVCGKPLTPAQMSDTNARKLMIDETGEYRWTHSHCGINHHTETKKRLAATMCATCGLEFKDNHMLVSGEVPKCRDGREYVRGPDVGTDVPAGDALPHEDAA